MRKILCFFPFALLAIALNGQINRYGVPVVRNYSTQITSGSEQNWCIARDNRDNIYFGNQDRGVIRYDGTRWSRIDIGKNNPRVYSLASDTSGIVYVGSSYELGYIQSDNRGKPEYVSLSSKTDSVKHISVILSILVKSQKVYFLCPKYIFVYDIVTDSVKEISLKEYNVQEALKIVEIDGRIVISDNKQGLFELKGDRIVQLPGGDFFRNRICLVLLSYGNGKILVGTFYDGAYLYDMQTGATESGFIDPVLNSKLKNAKIYSGAKISNDLFALGTTQDQGVMIIDRSGQIAGQLNTENSGLAENTILALDCDYKRGSELWISTQGYISKAYYNLPLTEFSDKQGVNSGLNGICEYNGRIFLSTDAGVLRSYVTPANTVAFEEVPGVRNEQVFPITVFRHKSGDFILAGSINGIFQITSSGAREINNIEILGKIPEGETGMVNTKKILQSVADPSVIYVGLNSGGIRIDRYDGQKWSLLRKITDIPGYINGMVEKEGGLWFITDDPSALYRADFSVKDTVIKYGEKNGLGNVEVNSIHEINSNIYVTTSSGIMRYDKASDTFVSDDSLTEGYSHNRNTIHLFSDNNGRVWYSCQAEKAEERVSGTGLQALNGVLNLLPNVVRMDIMSSGEKIYLLKSKTLYVIDKAPLNSAAESPKTFFVRIVAGADSMLLNGSFYRTDEKGRRIPVISDPKGAVPEIGYDMNEISFEWTTPYFTEELLTEYSCKLEGFDREWSKWEGISYGNTMEAQYFKKAYSNLPYGSYVFRVRTRTLTGESGEGLAYRFVILKPWYATAWAFFAFVLASLFIVYLIIKAYTRKLKNENLRLEGIVAERTAVVVKQKDELESSIHYARRIQMALLPSENILAENIRNYFVLFKPRDIVSGDFYWMTKKDERLYIVAADCTGHGVPGAFMSLLGMSFLDEIIDKDRALRADEILRELRLHVTESLKQVGNEDEAKDGMDIALLVIDFGTSKIEFSGAYNPCFRIRKLNPGENPDFIDQSDGIMTDGKFVLETIYASKMPIGISSRMNEDFVYHEWALEKGNTYYLFSDGYIDQFGGPDGRKFMKKNFKRLLLDIQEYPMDRQKVLLDENLKKWMGNSPQIDDILVMGIRTE